MIVKDTDLKELQDSDNYIALGSFDGVHLGHLSLIHKICEEAKRHNGKSIVYTFKNHYYFPSVGEDFVSNIVIDDQGEEHETGGPLYLDLSTNKLYKWGNLKYEFFDYAIEELQVITCGGAN